MLKAIRNDRSRAERQNGPLLAPLHPHSHSAIVPADSGAPGTEAKMTMTDGSEALVWPDTLAFPTLHLTSHLPADIAHLKATRAELKAFHEHRKVRDLVVAEAATSMAAKAAEACPLPQPPNLTSPSSLFEGVVAKGDRMHAKLHCPTKELMSHMLQRVSPADLAAAAREWVDGFPHVTHSECRQLGAVKRLPLRLCYWATFCM